MPMLQRHMKLLMLAVLAGIQVARAEPATQSSGSVSNGVRPSNVLGGLEQHASFSFVRPGLTQTAFAFNGPSSHQAFSSSVGDPHLAQRVLPSVANALAYRNPGLGYSPVSPISTAYAAGPQPAAAAPVSAYQQQQFDYQQQQQDSALAYQQQIQQYQQYQLQQQQFQQQYQQQQQQQQQYQQQYQQQQQQIYPGYSQQLQAEPIDAAAQQNAQQQAHLAQLVASRFAASPAQPVSSDAEQIQLQQQQQVQQQQQQQTANLLGVAYSAAPSVAHVKVSGNGYKFDF